MKPYRSTSPPSRFAQSSSPPAASVGSLEMAPPCLELMTELASSFASMVTDEQLGVVFAALELSTKLFWRLLVSAACVSQLTAPSSPCLYMERTLRDSIISSVESTRRLVDLPRTEGDRRAAAGVGRCCGMGVLGADAASAARSMCLLRRFAFLPARSMLPLLEKEMCESEVRSSRLPVGINVSRPAKSGPSAWGEPLEAGACSS